MVVAIGAFSMAAMRKGGYVSPFPLSFPSLLQALDHKNLWPHLIWWKGFFFPPPPRGCLNTHFLSMPGWKRNLQCLLGFVVVPLWQKRPLTLDNPVTGFSQTYPAWHGSSPTPLLKQPEYKQKSEVQNQEKLGTSKLFPKEEKSYRPKLAWKYLSDSVSHAAQFTHWGGGCSAKSPDAKSGPPWKSWCP